MPEVTVDCRLRRAILALSFSTFAPAVVAQGPQYAITLYNTRDAEPLFAGPVDYEPPPGEALVHEQRTIEVGAGRGTLTLNGFPIHLDATALSVTMDAGRVLNQRFDAESLRSERVLERSIGRRVSVEPSAGAEGAMTGELLSANLPLVVRLDDGSIASINDYSRIRVISPPPGFNALPQLRLGVESERAGPQTVRLTYPVHGLAWRADYAVQLDPNRSCRLDFSGFAQIVNRSGHSFPGASVKLVAGDFRRATGALTTINGKRTKSLPDSNGADDGEYGLEAPVDLPDGSVQQVALVPVQRQVRCSKERLYIGKSLRAQPHRVPMTDPGFGRGGNRRVRQTLSFALENGIALPAGRIRVLALDEQDGTPVFLAEQDIGLTPANQRLHVVVGDAPMLDGKRTVDGFKLDDTGLGLSETVGIRLSNRGSEPAKVRVREHLYRWKQWRITDNTHPYEPRDRDAIEFNVEVPANGEAQVSYRVHYRWTERYQ